METALRARLLADTGVKALAGNRTFWTVRKQGSPLPCVVLNTVADNRTQHMAGFNGFRSTRVQVDCYAADKAGAAALREAVIAALVPETTISGVTFLRAFVNSVLDRGEETDAGFIHRELVDLNIWHNA